MHTPANLTSSPMSIGKPLMRNPFHSDNGRMCRKNFVSYVRAALLVFVGALFGIVSYAGFIRVASGCGGGIAKHKRNAPLTRNIISLPKSLDPAKEQPDLDVDVLPKSKTLFADLPPEYSKTFYVECGKACHPVVRALRELGYIKVNRMEEGRLLLTDYSKSSWWTKQESWQRYSMLPATHRWLEVDNFYTTFHKYPYMLASYRLHDAQDREALHQFLSKKKSKQILKTQPWVYTGLDREGKQAIVEPLPKDLPDEGILTPYYCRPLTTTLANKKKHKFDVRVYWFVATLDPLLVFFQDGNLRISESPYNEGDYSKKGKWNNLMKYEDFNHHEGKQPFGQLQEILDRAAVRNFPKRVDRFQHVRNQMKEAVALMVDTLADSGLSLSENNDHDGWELMVADFVIEEDTLNVWLIDTHSDSDLHEDNYHDLQSAHDLYYGIGSILHEVWTKQEQLSQSILPIQNPGEWDLIYVGGEDAAEYKYEYKGFDRQEASKEKRRACARKTKG